MNHLNYEENKESIINEKINLDKKEMNIIN